MRVAYPGEHNALRAFVKRHPSNFERPPRRQSAHDGLPEPLCAIWEPASATALEAYQKTGKDCPRKFLLRSAARLIQPIDRRALDNINTPDQYAQAIDLLGDRS